MKTMFSWLGFIINTSLCGVGMVAIYNQFEHKQIPLWAGPIFMAVLGAMTFATRFAENKGWIKSRTVS